MSKGHLSFFLLLACLFTAVISRSQDSNIELLANVDEFPQDQYNDIWGYVDKAGREYAILGTRKGTAVYLLSDPRRPKRVAYIPGSQSIWRDMKSYGDFVFVTADQGQDGLLAINMSGAPDNITWQFYRPTLTQGTTSFILNTCHNLYIDNKGFAYLSGCNINQGGVLIFDVGKTPGVPQFAGYSRPVYSHDSYTRGDTLWSSEIYAGGFAAIDVRNKQAPRLLATQPTSSRFTHNAWLSDDGKYLFTTDEVANGFVDAYDVSDLGNIRFLDRFQPSVGKSVFPHNTHYYRGFLATSWYTDGVVITDASRPDNLIEVGRYDTYPGPDGGTEGCWGAYPFLPSGILLASDIRSGMYVLKANYERACYLEGKVSNAASGAPLAAVQVAMLPGQTSKEESNLQGIFKTGQAAPGLVKVAFYKLGFFPDTLEVMLESGKVTELDISLRPKAVYSISGRTIAASNGQAVPQAQVLLQNPEIEYLNRSDAAGNFALTGVLEGGYELYAGKWGYLTSRLPAQDLSGNRNAEIALQPGYADDFLFNHGWTVNSTAPRGAWVWGVPKGTVLDGQFANPAEDVDTDFGRSCYMTGNGGGQAGTDDLDDGETILTSPAMDLRGYQDPVLSYRAWFYNAGGNGLPNDSLLVQVSNGATTAILEVITQSSGAWRKDTAFHLSKYLTLTENMRVQFIASDRPGTGHIVEAAVDAVQVRENGQVTATRGARAMPGQLIPRSNPCAGDCEVQYRLPSNVGTALLLVHNALGEKQAEYRIPNNAGALSLPNSLPAGIYWLTLHSGGDILASTRLVIAK